MVNRKSCCDRIQQRWVFGIMGFLTVMNTGMMESCLSLAITEMVVETNSSEYTDGTCAYLSDSTNSTTTTRNIAAGIYDWDERLQGLILSSFFWGYVITQLAGGMLSDRFGGKYILGFGVLSMSILTLLTPFAVDTGGSTALIVFRFLIGLGDGTAVPALTTIVAKWAPPSERSKIGSLVFSGNAIGVMIGNTISGFLMHYSPLGWRLVFYVYGSSGILWFLAWMILCYNNPDKHPFISAEEKKYLHDSMSEHTHKNIPPTPWRHILRSVPVWAFLVSSLGQDWGCFTLMSDLPKYMSNVLKFPVKMNGLLTGLPSLFLWLASLPYSWLADWLINSGTMSRTNVRKLFTTLSTVVPAFFFVATSYVGCDRVLIVALFSAAIILIGAMYPGVRVNSLDLSPNYSGTLLAIANVIGAFAGMVSPYVVGILTPNQTTAEWSIVFWIVGIIYCSTNLVYVVYASGEVQYWNDPEFLIREQEERNNMAAGERTQELHNLIT